MKASYLWIKDYLPDYSGSPEEMQHELTFSGTEVEEVEPCGDDSVLDLGVTSNRVDCLGHIGLAREVATVSGAKLVLPACDVAAKGAATRDTITIKVEDPEICPRYTAQIIEGITIGPSPSWLCKRLEAVGLVPVNNVVDITNFVLLEFNQPLHAFDLGLLAGNQIVVRRAHKGEIFRAINDKEYVLSPDDLVIADEKCAVAMAGVMGGKHSEVTNTTTSLLLESAMFDPVTVRRTSRAHKLQSDSSFRFERGIDRHGALQASMRAAALILDLCGGTLRQKPLDVGGPGPEPSPIDLRVARVERICGIPVAPDRVSSILTSLECGVEVAEENTFRVTPPTFRRDLSREIDLIEEVIRVHGFVHVPEKIDLPVRAAREHPQRVFRERVKDRLAALGLMEVSTPNFVREDLCGDVAFLQEGAGLCANLPVRAGEGALRRSLLPSLLEVRKRNYDIGNDDLRFFEVSNLHFATGKDGAVPDHVPAMGFLIDGDVRDGRGVVEGLLEHLGLGMTMGALDTPWLEAGSCGSILVGETPVGVLGYPVPNLLKTLGLKRRPLFGEIRLDVILDATPATKKLRSLPRLPSVTRDISLVVSEEITYNAVQSRVTELDLSSLESVSMLGDVYRARQIGEGKKNVVVRLVFRSATKTLVAEDVDSEVRRLIDDLRQALHAEMR